jgi:hypothetical protein
MCGRLPPVVGVPDRLEIGEHNIVTFSEPDVKREPRQ